MDRQGLLDAERGPDGYRDFDENSVVMVPQIRALLTIGLSDGAAITC